MYKYYNHNPQGWKIPDCVIRAISLALNIDYYEVVKMLHLNANELHCDCLNVQCYEKLLDYDFNLPHYHSYGLTAQEIAEEFSDRIVLLRMEGHLSVAIFGDILDIWNCSQEEITDFWLV